MADKNVIGAEVQEYLDRTGLTMDNVEVLNLIVVHHSSMEEGLHCFLEGDETNNYRKEAVFALLPDKNDGDVQIITDNLKLRHFSKKVRNLPQTKHKENTEEIDMDDVIDFRRMSCSVLNTFCGIVRETEEGDEISLSVVKGFNKDNIIILVRDGYLSYSLRDGYAFTDKGNYIRKINEYILSEKHPTLLTPVENIMRDLFLFKKLSYDLKSSRIISH